jgi:hypothetical protein
VLDALGRLSEADDLPALEAPLMPVLTQRLDEFLRWRLDRPLKTLERA